MWDDATSKAVLFLLHEIACGSIVFDLISGSTFPFKTVTRKEFVTLQQMASSVYHIFKIAVSRVLERNHRSYVMHIYLPDHNRHLRLY